MTGGRCFALWKFGFFCEAMELSKDKNGYPSPSLRDWGILRKYSLPLDENTQVRKFTPWIICPWSFKSAVQILLELCATQFRDGQTDNGTDGRAGGQRQIYMPPLFKRWGHKNHTHSRYFDRGHYDKSGKIHIYHPQNSRLVTPLTQ